MTPKRILIASVLSVSAFVTPVVNAASPTTDVPRAETQKPESQVSPHSHVQEKLAVSTPKAADSKLQHAKKPLHDHNKFHKNQ
ncbi:hypothetical protein [Aromatoleum evansii]|uniref:hypothetical protein n=1 Tax=Aromatoleum evansii TaxID=59406 RepID=UPI00145D5472|nr:hypothetical protein [Aromatoleum evansii]NMG29964.1 hypothetical protein [Aromatoleum evansii]